MKSAVLNWATIGFGFLAAILWLKSTLTKVPANPDSTDFQITDTGMGRPYDVLETMKRQVVWNRWAALATAVAVLTQAVSMFCRTSSLSDFGVGFRL